MSELAKKQCVPCVVGTPPLKGDELAQMMTRLDGWELLGESEIKKAYRFKDFKGALAFVNAIGKIAEEEGHHPDIELGWGKVVLKLSTHKIKGLSESDFIMAAKCDAVMDSYP